MAKSLVDKLEPETLRLLNNAEIPITVDYIARELSIAWDTARAILLGLACQRRIKAIKTMKSWVFKPIDTNEV